MTTSYWREGEGVCADAVLSVSSAMRDRRSIRIVVTSTWIGARRFRVRGIRGDPGDLAGVDAFDEIGFDVAQRLGKIDRDQPRIRAGADETETIEAQRKRAFARRAREQA